MITKCEKKKKSELWKSQKRKKNTIISHNPSMTNKITRNKSIEKSRENHIKIVVSMLEFCKVMKTDSQKKKKKNRNFGNGQETTTNLI